MSVEERAVMSRRQPKKDPSGAWYEPGDGVGYILPGMDKDAYAATMAFLECRFDEIADRDDAKAKFIMNSKRYSRASALIKTLLFIPEYVLTRIFHGEQDARARYEIQRLYWAYLRGKITEADLHEAQAVLSMELIERLKGFR